MHVISMEYFFIKMQTKFEYFNWHMFTNVKLRNEYNRKN